MWLQLSYLQVQPVAKLSMCPTDTQTGLVTQTAADKALPSAAPTCGTHVIDKQTAVSAPPQAHRDRRTLVKTGVHTHT